MAGLHGDVDGGKSVSTEHLATEMVLRDAQGESPDLTSDLLRELWKFAEFGSFGSRKVFIFVVDVISQMFILFEKSLVLAP